MHTHLFIIIDANVQVNNEKKYEKFCTDYNSVCDCGVYGQKNV